MKHFLTSISIFFVLCSCSGNRSFITPETISTTIYEATAKYPQADSSILALGIRQTAALWQKEDGSEDEFKVFVLNHIQGDADSRKELFDKLSGALEILNGGINKISTELQKPTVLAGPEPTETDCLLAAYNPSAHLSDDFFKNKLAFIFTLNFPHYSHSEKIVHETEWSRLEWAYARMGDIFTSRVPAEVYKKTTDAMNDAENYISSYNIMMGHLLTEDGRRLFPEDMALISHWNLRDEIKSNYADVPFALEKQEMIYKVMERIVCQDIPSEVVNNPAYDWAPYSNKTWKDGAEVSLAPESDRRYRFILGHFHAFLEVDEALKGESDAITRNFDEEMEFSVDELEKMFVKLLSSEEVAECGKLIKKRLGRDLRPFDIWYDGFKSRSRIPEDKLSARTQSIYPSAKAFHNDCPRLLKNLGFSSEKAEYISSRVTVEGSRGPGHALQCESRDQNAYLRTRIVDGGMDYKGFNIATHEFGHNVEQVLSLYDIDYYTLRGIPSTGFTEALAFLFQIRDLQLLGYGSQTMDSEAVLDKFWSMYEIMGVSMVEMENWKWLYAHKNATAAEYREAVLKIARSIWNQYFEPVLGTHDSPILAIYSHMVDYPMYLPSYSIGDIVHFQLEQHLASCKNPAEFASEIERIYTLGHLTPNAWMRAAVGANVSIEPMIEAAHKVLM